MSTVQEGVSLASKTVSLVLSSVYMYTWISGILLYYYKYFEQLRQVSLAGRKRFVIVDIFQIHECHETASFGR